MTEETSYNLILLGGTGARCGEIFIHMCANGYFTGKKVNILYIDSDLENGNADSMKAALNAYNACRENYLIESNPVPGFFKTEIDYERVSPVGNVKYFKNLANIDQPDTESIRATNALMRALYSDEEYNMQISDGFFARPNVGTALFAANMEHIMERLLKKIQNERGLKKFRIFIIGSVFGGTGASSLPTISKYLKKKLYGESTDKRIGDKLKIGGCMLLPYFSFSKENVNVDEEEGGIKIEVDKFSVKTKAAIEYYRDTEKQSSRAIFDALYILGHDKNDVRGMYEKAGKKQHNLPHIVEFYGAMSGVTFFEGGKFSYGKNFAVVPEDKITWTCMYEHRRCILGFLVMMRFALVMKSLILEEMFDRESNRSDWNLRDTATQIPWYYDFLEGRCDSKDMDTSKLGEKFNVISNYCDVYIRWFAELIIKNPGRRKNPDTIDTKIKRNQKNIYGDLEENDLLDYIELFDYDLILKQYMNDLIESGSIKYPDEKTAGIYKKNLEFIRKNAANLSDIRLTDMVKAKNIKFDDVWSRLNSFGYNSFVKYDGIFKNIEKSDDKTMDEGVRNLINAIYIACMI